MIWVDEASSVSAVIYAHHYEYYISMPEGLVVIVCLFVGCWVIVEITNRLTQYDKWIAPVQQRSTGHVISDTSYECQQVM